MEKIKVLLTGGSGFIGRNILEKISGKYEFYAPAHSDLDLCDSVAVEKYLNEQRVDVIVHAASTGLYSSEKSTDFVQDNLKIFFNLVRQKKYFKRMIVIGSGAEYDKSKPMRQVRETDFDMSVPSDQYGFTKYILAKYAEQVDYITHFRPFGVYGKYEDYTKRFISGAICKALLGKPITLKQNVKFDYIFIDDLVDIIDKVIQKKPKEIFYNIGSGSPVQLVDLAKKIIEFVNPKINIEIQEAGEGKEYTANCERLQKELKPKYTDFEDTLRSLTEYYKNILPTISGENIL